MRRALVRLARRGRLTLPFPLARVESAAAEYRDTSIKARTLEALYEGDDSYRAEYEQADEDASALHANLRNEIEMAAPAIAVFNGVRILSDRPPPDRRRLLAAMHRNDVVIKSCRCGCTYSRVDWSRLPCVGLMEGGEVGRLLDMRNCPRCGSTIAIELDRREYVRAEAAE